MALVYLEPALHALRLDAHDLHAQPAREAAGYPLTVELGIWTTARGHGAHSTKGEGVGAPAPRFPPPAAVSGRQVFCLPAEGLRTRGLRALEHGAVVQLDHAHGSGRRGIEAELAEHALVEAARRSGQPEAVALKMSTGQTSSSFLASSTSARTLASTWTSMKRPGIRRPLRASRGRRPESRRSAPRPGFRRPRGERSSRWRCPPCPPRSCRRGRTTCPSSPRRP